MNETGRHSTDEIEITPEMIEAGCFAWNTYDSRFEDLDAVVKRIFSAMRTLEPGGLFYVSRELGDLQKDKPV